MLWVLLTLTGPILTSQSDEVIVPEIIKMRELHAMVGGYINMEKAKSKDVNITFYLGEEPITFPITIYQNSFQASLVFSDHFPDEKVFTKDVTVSIGVGTWDNTIYGHVAIPLNIPPNAQLCKVITTDENLNFTINLKYHCQNYTGDNCMFEVLETEKLTTDYYYGLVCRKEEDCDLDEPCESSFCNDHGKCYLMYYEQQKICQCDDFWAGPNCEISENTTFDTENYRRFNIQLDVVAKRDNCDECKNKESCLVYEVDFVVCTCPEKSTTGRFCQFTCDPACPIGYCAYEPNGKGYHCINEMGSTINDKGIEIDKAA